MTSSLTVCCLLSCLQQVCCRPFVTFGDYAIRIYYYVCTWSAADAVQTTTRTKLAALYSATKSLQNSCTAKLQLFSSLLEAKEQLHSSCSGLQKRCAAFEGSLKLSAAVLQRSCRLSNAAKLSCCNVATIQLRSIWLSWAPITWVAR